MFVTLQDDVGCVGVALTQLSVHLCADRAR